MIKKIEKENSWYVIYATKEDSTYKIVSKTHEIQNCASVIVGKQYVFNLKSYRQNAPMINNIKLDPVGYTGCYQFDAETNICLEPKQGIYDLYYTEDLNGLCYQK